jgi:hypothetical protein
MYKNNFMKLKKNILILFLMVFINSIHSNEPMNLLKNILVNNYPKYFLEDGDFGVIGNISSNNIVYTIVYNKQFWGNGRMTGRLVIFDDYKIIGHYGVINEMPEIINNKIIFKDAKYNENSINFDDGIPERILIDGEPHNFEYYQDIQRDSIFYGKIILKEYYGPPNYGEDIINDAVEKHYVLLLYEPITIYFKGSCKNITEIQLINLHDTIRIGDYRNLNCYIYGEPFTAQTGHHYTDLIMIVNRIIHG